MSLYRRIIPKIARDTIRALLAKKLIEVEDGKIEEAELDLAAVMVGYLNTEDTVIKEARDTLARRGLSYDRFAQAKKTIADIKGFKTGEEGIDYILEQMLESLFASKNVVEVFGEDHEIKKNIKEVMDKYLSVSEDLDKEARARLKNLREGTAEWEIEYPRLVAQMKRQKGLV